MNVNVVTTEPLTPVLLEAVIVCCSDKGLWSRALSVYRTSTVAKPREALPRHTKHVPLLDRGVNASVKLKDDASSQAK